MFFFNEELYISHLLRSKLSLTCLFSLTEIKKIWEKVPEKIKHFKIPLPLVQNLIYIFIKFENCKLK